MIRPDCFFLTSSFNLLRGKKYGLENRIAINFIHHKHIYYQSCVSDRNFGYNNNNNDNNSLFTNVPLAIYNCTLNYRYTKIKSLKIGTMWK